ncbi:MAG: hypothetical protein U0228_14870 [Myxococcaceae bacterium]
MRWLAVFALAGCAAVPVRVPQTPPTLDARSLEGSWAVVASTFPMWLDGSRREPRFHYSAVRTEAGRVVLDDRVTYSAASGEPGQIDGVDVQHAQVPTHFTWSGRGFLAAFTSEWDVASLDPTGRYAIIVFSPTLATPAGLDVIAREPIDSQELERKRAELEAEVRATPAFSGYATSLRWL